MKSLSLARQLRRQKVAEASGNTKMEYFGPEVEAGYSYGKYGCSDCGFEQISIKGELIHCVNCGSTTDLKAEASLKAVKASTSKVTSEFYCNTCGEITISSSEDAKDEAGMFCPQCGSVMEAMDGDGEGDELGEEDIEVEEINDEDDLGDEDLDIEEIDVDENSDEDVDLEEDITVEENPDEDLGLEEDINVEEENPEEDMSLEDDTDENFGDDIEVEEINDEDDLGDEDLDIEEIDVDENSDEDVDLEEDITVEEDNPEEDMSLEDVNVEEENPEEDKAGCKRWSGSEFEFITPIEEKASFSVEDVQMAFYDSDDPAWTVLIKGSPVATIKLSDQQKPDEIADMFVTDTYAQNVAKAMIQCGPKEVLDQIKAKYFVNKIDESDLAKKMADKIKSEMGDAYKAKAASLRDDFKSCIAVVLAGMNRNFWRDLENPLKGALFASLESIGVSDPSQVIEEAFTQGADPYFNIVLSKAIEFMDKTPEAREEISKAITEANTIVARTVTDIPRATQFAQRLEKNNIIATVTGGKNLAGKNKTTIKDTVKLGHFYG